jgi:MYXO-CTERM domain-containing protein
VSGPGFVTLPRVNRRLRHLAALAAVCCAVAGAATPAGAFTPAEGRAAADKAAMAWARDYQQKDGAILDNIARRPTYGYATLMIGYSLVRAGVRHKDPAVVKSGFRAIDAALRRNNPHRGVFDELVNATAYAWVRKHLPNDPSFRALRARWERYLVTIGQPFIGSSGLKKCTVNPRCFHNHEAVGAYGDLQMLKTGLRSHVRGAKLSDLRALRASAVHRLAVEIPPSVDSSASWTFGGTTRTGLGLLSDTGTWPLAYHAFSTAMLAGAAADLGPKAPPAMRGALLRTEGALAGMMGPDGDIAYLGRRQEQAWALASAIYAAVVGQRLRGVGPREAGELRAVADRAFTRLVTVNRNGPGGIGAVPRKLRPGQSYHGLDANSVTPVALTLFLLNLASDEAEARGQAAPGALPADAEGAFVSRTKMAFAAVRHGDLWYVVHRNRITYDRRYDFGLVALKQRDANGRWHDVMRPRPNTRGHTHDSAGPVLERGTKIRYLPHGTSIKVRRGGVVLVHGGFQTQDGKWLRRGVTFRFAPVTDGVQMTFPLRAGDNARVTDFVPDGQAKRLGNTIYDDNSSAVVSPAPTRFRFLARGLGSCCDESLIEAMALLHAPRDETYTYTVRAAHGPPKGAAPVEPERRHKVSHSDGGGSSTGVIWAVAVALVLGLGAWRARRRRRIPH